MRILITALMLLFLATPSFALIENQNILGQDIRNEVLKNVNVINSNIVNSDITQSSIIDSRVKNSNLVNVDVDNTGLIDVSIDHAKIKNSAFANASLLSSTVATSRAINSEFTDSFIDSSALADSHFDNSNIIDTDLKGRNSFEGSGMCINDGCENKLSSTPETTHSNNEIEKTSDNNQDSNINKDIITKSPQINSQQSSVPQASAVQENAGVEKQTRERNVFAVFIQDKIENFLAGSSKFINTFIG